MGCDIHAFVEGKLDNEWLNIMEADIHRDYGLFAMLAGVRNYDGVDPIAEPRGLPLDCSKFVKVVHDDWGGDAHTESWISLDEFLMIGQNIPGFYKEEYEHLFTDIRLVFWFDN